VLGLVRVLFESSSQMLMVAVVPSQENERYLLCKLLILNLTLYQVRIACVMVCYYVLIYISFLIKDMSPLHRICILR